MSHGSGSLLDYLSIADNVERIVADEILQEAEKMRERRQKQFFENLQATVHNAITGAFK